MKLKKHEIKENMYFKVKTQFIGFNQYIKLEIPITSTLTRVKVYNNIVTFLVLESNKSLSCNYETFKESVLFYKSDIIPTFHFAYRKYLNTDYYRLLLYNNRNRIVMTFTFLRILQMSQEEYHNLLLSLGAQKITEYNNYYVKEYEYIAFIDEYKAKQAVEYFNEHYITMIALLYPSLCTGEI